MGSAMSQEQTAVTLPFADKAERQQFKSQNHYQIAWRRLRHNVLAMGALGFLVFICAVSIAAPWIDTHIVGYDPNRGRLTQRLKPPNAEHRLGTDDFGRDVLARIIDAGRVSLSFGFMVAFVS